MLAGIRNISTKTKTLFPSGVPIANEVNQRTRSNCYFLSIVIGILKTPNGYKTIMRCFPDYDIPTSDSFDPNSSIIQKNNERFEKSSTVKVRLFDICDNSFCNLSEPPPTVTYSISKNKILHGSFRVLRNIAAPWLKTLEMAWNKYRKDNIKKFADNNISSSTLKFHRSDSGAINDDNAKVYSALVGRVAGKLKCTTANRNVKTNNDPDYSKNKSAPMQTPSIWESIRKALSENNIVEAGCFNNTRRHSHSSKQKGLTFEHSYTVLDVFICYGRWWIIVRDPHGQKGRFYTFVIENSKIVSLKSIKTDLKDQTIFEGVEITLKDNTTTKKGIKINDNGVSILEFSDFAKYFFTYRILPAPPDVSDSETKK